MTGPLWINTAERLTASAPGGSPDFPGVPPRVVAHTTESPAGGKGDDPDYWFKAMDRVLRSKSAEPTLLYDPLTDKLGQYFPLNATARALKNDGSTRSNRVGRVCIQIEFIGYASRPFTRTWRPGPNFQAMMRSIGLWGVPDLWPSGKPPAYPSESDERSRSVWLNRAGWYGHSQVPGNFHGDPGEIDDDGEFFRAELQPAEYWPGWRRKYPGRDAVGPGKARDRLNLLVKAALVVHQGVTGYRGEITGKWDKTTADKLDDFKTRLEIEESGLGPKTWRALGTAPAEVADFPGPKSFEIGKSSGESLTGQALLALQGFRETLGWALSREWRPDARRALRRFQLSEPVLAGDADGEWGPLTWRTAWEDRD